MSDADRSDPADAAPVAGVPADRAPAAGPSRRLLMLGAVTASAVVSIRPALAQTAGSVMACEIPVPDLGRAGSFISPEGNVVPAGTQGAFPSPGRAFKGEEVKRALSGGQLPGTTWESNRAYVSYIRRLQRGTGGFTCFASLQMPRG